MGKFAKPEDYEARFRVTVTVECLKAPGIEARARETMPYYGAGWIVPKDMEEEFLRQAANTAMVAMRDALFLEKREKEADLG